MPREKKYKTAKTFAAAVDGYFSSISRTVNVRLLDPEKEEWYDAVNDDGEPIKDVQYIVPPSLSAMCLKLGISRQTFSHYAADTAGGYAAVCEYARLRVQAYLEEQLKSRTKGLSGIIFDLQANFGWKEKREVAIDEETRRDMKQTLTMDEKLALIRAAAEDLPPVDADES